MADSQSAEQETPNQLLQELVRQNKIRQIERSHLLVSIAVFSASVTLLVQGDYSISISYSFLEPSGFVTLLVIHATISTLLIPAQLLLGTLRNVDFNNSILPEIFILVINKIHEKASWSQYYGAIHKRKKTIFGRIFGSDEEGVTAVTTLAYIVAFFQVIVLIGGTGTIFGALLFPEFSHSVFSEIYIVIELLLLYQFATGYAADYKNKMSKVSTSTTNRTVTVTRGPRGETTEIRVQNKTDEELDPDDVRFLVRAPQDVEVELDQAYRDAEKQSAWVLADPLAPGKTIRVPVEINIASTRNAMSTDDVSIMTIVNDSQVATDHIEIQG